MVTTASFEELEQQKKENSYNLVGVIAHSGFSTIKLIGDEFKDTLSHSKYELHRKRLAKETNTEQHIESIKSEPHTSSASYKNRLKLLSNSDSIDESNTEENEPKGP